MQAMMPWSLVGSGTVLLAVVLLKSALFAVFEKRLPRIRAALVMFLGNIVSSVVGVIAAGIIGSAVLWLLGVPIVILLCVAPAHRLIRRAPIPWLARRSPASLAALMTLMFCASCVLFAVTMYWGGSLAWYWVVKLAAVYLALGASIALTTIWEEWVVWRLSGLPGDTEFFSPVLRTNLCVLLFVMAISAAVMLPKRLKSPDFLALRQPVPAVCERRPANAEGPWPAISGDRVRVPRGRL
jgi:hypothetical protein